MNLLSVLGGFFSRPWDLVLVDIADIAIVAFVVYRVLLVLRGTRAMQMSVVVVAIAGAYQFARAQKLVTLFTLLDAVLTHAVLIVVVVFQNDIRRGLMRLARRPLFRLSATTKDTAVIEEVVRAAQHLAQKRVGALIVFERNAGLDEFIDQGTLIDSHVSHELLYGMFLPSYENPLHDGAVILRDGRVWLAGAVLPLSSNSQLDKTLGTRHRAALGITEETDAVVVVVSEERGAMSLCFGGNIVPALDSLSLREALLGLFAKSTSRAMPVEPARRSIPPRVRIPSERSSLRPTSLKDEETP
jgi:diadenylate cyclase